MKRYYFKRDRAVGVVVHKRQLLVIRRVRQDHEYYALPGGGIDKGETPAEAAVREVWEETAIKTRVIRQVYHHQYKHGEHYYFLCRYLSGSPLLIHGDEKFKHQVGSNEFHPQWIPISQLADISLRPSDIRPWLLEDLNNGFAEQLRHQRLKTHGDWKRI